MVRKGGLEPPRYCYRQPLKLVRLPIPPLPQVVSGVWGPDFSPRSYSPVEGPDVAIKGIARPAGAGHDADAYLPCPAGAAVGAGAAGAAVGAVAGAAGATGTAAGTVAGAVGGALLPSTDDPLPPR